MSTVTAMRTTWPRSSARFVGLPASARVDSNSTRTESCVAMGPDPEAQMQVDAPKAADHSGYQQIICPSWGMQAGLKILCPISLQGSGSTECGRGEHPGRFTFFTGHSQVHSHAIPTRWDHWR